MTSQKTSPPDINTLAAEVMDLWQEHLEIYAADPKAKAELMRMLEPQRQLFADWAIMMQNGLHGTSSETATAPRSSDTATQPPTKPSGAAPVAFASDDGALRLAQLAHRMADLEKRMARIESRYSGGSSKTPRRKSH